MIHPFGLGDVLLVLAGFQWTIVLSIVAFVGSAVLGLGVLGLNTSRSLNARLLAQAFIQLMQGIPLLGLLLLFFFGIALLGYDTSAWVAATIGLSLYGSAFLSDIWSGAVRAVPRGQWEASHALGLSRWQRFRLVISPQAFVISIPPTVGFLVQLIKNTSVASIVGVVELSRSAQIISSSTFEFFGVYALICLLYFCLCFPLTWYSRRLEATIMSVR